MKQPEYQPNALYKIEVLNDIYEMILHGLSRSVIVDKLMTDFLFEEQVAIQYYESARKKIADEALVDLDQIIHTHVAIYEQIYQYFDHVDYHSGRIKTLKQKEALLGLHKDETIIEVNNTVNVEIEKESEYDIQKLTIEEQNRLQGYLAKMR